MMLLIVVAALAAGGSAGTVTIDWTDVLAHSRTIPTLQVVANPVLNPKTSPIAQRAFEHLALLDAELVRYVPCFPYPRVGVAELDPPNARTRTTSWDFSGIAPQLELFLDATVRRGRSAIPNFSTQPTWMYNTSSWDYPSDPNVVDWNYPRGNQRANTTQLLADYYARLLTWYTRGVMTDEFGHQIGGGPRAPLTHWEVFNEPQGCHGLDVAGYTLQYDAIVTRIRRDVDPQTKFVGLALEQQSDNYAWMEYFMNASNHAPGVPLDIVSFHYYAIGTSRENTSTYEDFFAQADTYLQNMKSFAALRDRMSPRTMLSCDEMGVILPNDNDPGAAIPPPVYWVASSGYFAYMYGHAATIGIEILGESQFAGCPAIPEWGIASAQYPSVSMINWTTGVGNARFWTLKLLLDETEPGDIYVSTTASPDLSGDLFAQAFQGRDGRRKLLLVNKKQNGLTFTVAGAAGGVMQTIDEGSGEGPATHTQLTADSITLARFAVAIVLLPGTQ